MPPIMKSELSDIVARFSEPKAPACQPSGRPEQAALGGIHYFDACHAARFRHCGGTREPIEPATCRNFAAIAFSQNGESIAPLVPAYKYSSSRHQLGKLSDIVARFSEPNASAFQPRILRCTPLLRRFILLTIFLIVISYPSS